MSGSNVIAWPSSPEPYNAAEHAAYLQRVEKAAQDLIREYRRRSGEYAHISLSELRPLRDAIDSRPANVRTPR